MKIILRSTVVALGALMITGVQAESGPAVAPASQEVHLNTQQDKVSYALGFETGQSFKSHNIELNANLFSQGLSDGVQGSKPRLTDEEMQTVISNFQKETLAKMQAQLKDKAAQNKKAGDAFLAENKNKSGVVTTASGLQYKIIEPGQGNRPTDNDIVTVDYEGKLLNGQVFDSSYKRGKPVSFPVSAVISGWQEALKLMKSGATAEIYIPPNLAYGEQGAAGVIGPNEVLIFKVHLISVKPGAAQNANQSGAATSSATTSGAASTTTTSS